MTTRLVLRLTLLLLIALEVLWVFHAYGPRPFVYALDDPYIHLTLARNLASTGVLGLNPGEWSSASSSPAWTLLLTAGDGLFGDRVGTPLVLNLLICAGLAWWIVGFLEALGYEPVLVLALGGAFVLLVPLVPLAFSGMEHLLHLAVVLALVVTTVAAVEGRGRAVWPLLLAAAATAVRYESLFLLAGLGLLLLFRRRTALAVGLVAAGAAVALILGAVNIAHGESLLPNTFLVKALSAVPGESLWHAHLIRLETNAAQGGIVLALMALAGVLLYLRGRLIAVPSAWALGLGAFLIAAALHLLLASVGWFYRYEAYLVGLGFVLVLAALAPGGEVGSRKSEVESGGARRRGARLAVGGAALLLLVGHARVTALGETPRAMDEIYRQQYQMARFVRQYYGHAAVACNDVGAVSYYNPGTHVVDLMGLGYYPLALARARGLVTKTMLEQVAAAQGARVAITYLAWFRNGLPPHWRLVGTWTTTGAHLVVGAQEVGFFALGESPAGLREQLEEFAPSLPPRVVVAYP